ncbi:MAG: prepilin-type N-terminal cleavage/methylation domain-containing protein [Candidatus Omnitrophica bacterium]|nr:prepilin-type N-terminal cleavage/methylation domain-containing protein [Candidatus Omnitrophota bacterium]
MRMNSGNQKGYTLTEIMLVMGLIGMAGYMLFSATRAGNEGNSTREAKMGLQDGTREALYKMTQEIRQSSPTRITVGVGNTDIQFSIPDPSSLTTTSNYTLNWASAHTIKYAKVGTQLLRTDMTTGKIAVLCSDVTSLSFVGNANPPTLLSIVVNVQHTTPEGRTIPTTPLQLTAQAEVRNSG